MPGATIAAGLAEALADPSQPQAGFAALDHALQAAAGHRLLTVLRYRFAEGDAERLYSNQPALFPAGSRKPFADAPIQRRVAETGLPYIGRDAADLRRDFPDHDKIFALGCASILNMPVVWRGRALGQVNLLHEEHRYAAHHLPLVRVLAQMTIPLFLALETA